MSLRSIHPLTEMSKGGRCVRLTTLPSSSADYLEILESSSCNPQGLSRPVMRLLLLCYLLDYGLDSNPGRKKYVYFLRNVQSVFGGHPAFYVMATGVLFLGVKRPGCDVNH